MRVHGAFSEIRNGKSVSIKKAPIRKSGLIKLVGLMLRNKGFYFFLVNQLLLVECPSH